MRRISIIIFITKLTFALSYCYGQNEIDYPLLKIDSATGLCWTKNDFSFIKNRFLTNWKETVEWKDEMNTSNYGGFSDWRVPTISEYRTINKNKKDREIYRNQFNEMDSVCVWGKGAYSFWSATTPNKFTASYISFIDGFATSGDREKQFSSPYSSWNGVELGMSTRLVRNIKKK